ncbi:MAG: hypothetical protein LBJ00_02720 [Planctomycetaceae bacterium]|nr:hypothetical protein [Planctomycetaceae bacterium]
MKQNPIYRLEMQQMQHYHLPLIMSSLGTIMGVYMIFHSEELWTCFFLIPVVFYLSALLIPMTLASKLGRQQTNEDLLLHTPLTGSDVLWGKFWVVMTMLFCLYAPCLPSSLFLLLFYSEPYESFVQWFIGLHFISFFATICITMTGLGFMAGARTKSLQHGLFFLFAIFIFGLMVLPLFISLLILSLWFDLLQVNMAGSASYDRIGWHIGVMALVITLIFSFVVFRIGFFIFDKNEIQLSKYCVCLSIVAVIGSPLSMVAMFPFAFILWITFFSVLIITIFSVMGKNNHPESQKILESICATKGADTR